MHKSEESDEADSSEQDHAVEKTKQAPRRFVRDRGIYQGHDKCIEGDEPDESGVYRRGKLSGYGKDKADDGKKLRMSGPNQVFRQGP